MAEVNEETQDKENSGKGGAQAGAKAATAPPSAQEAEAAPDAYRHPAAASFQFHEHVKRVFLQRFVGIGSIEF